MEISARTRAPCFVVASLSHQTHTLGLNYGWIGRISDSNWRLSLRQAKVQKEGKCADGTTVKFKLRKIGASVRTASHCVEYNLTFARMVPALS